MTTKFYEHTYDSVFSACKQALDKLDFTIDDSNKRTGTIRASTSVSLISWGEKVEITIKEISRYRTKLSVESKAKAQLFDWGKSETNELEFISKVSQLLR
jgi:hypothetical protein